ncbi:MAG TPA: hypothetical protein VE863_06500 [Pyrinomonadaceae bacterium]|nr:hypothetical protein [Pyrinomonadaceae bacterium]
MNTNREIPIGATATATTRGRIITICLLMLGLGLTCLAQRKDASWIELSRKDADRMLTNSPWSQTQVDSDLTESFYSPTKAGTSSVGRADASRGTVSDQQAINNNRADRGAVNEAIHTSYRISFLSSRPVRQALAKTILAAEREPNDQLVKQLQSFVERDFSQYIVIAVTVTSTDGRFSGPIMQAINSATTGTLKNNAYLERTDGQRLFLMQYIAPIPDNLGAKFIFPRLVDGQPFLKSDSGTVRFYAEFNDSFKLNMRYKVADMIYDQKLEY